MADTLLSLRIKSEKLEDAAEEIEGIRQESDSRVATQSGILENVGNFSIIR